MAVCLGGEQYKVNHPTLVFLSHVSLNSAGGHMTEPSGIRVTFFEQKVRTVKQGLMWTYQIQVVLERRPIGWK